MPRPSLLRSAAILCLLAGATTIQAARSDQIKDRFHDMILSNGHTQEYAPMFKAFYGKDPDIGPMLEDRGLTAGAK